MVALSSYLGGCLDSRSGEGDTWPPVDTIEETDGTEGPDTADTVDTRDTTDTAGTADTVDTVDIEVGEPDTRPPACPVAVFDIVPGTEIRPGTTLQLDGSRSYGDGVPVVDYHWEVDQPNGSCVVFRPSANVPRPSFDIRIAGAHRVRLRVTDARGRRSCVDAEQWVFAIPTEAIRVELLWWAVGNDPGWPLTAGPDLDLHFTHPLAVGAGDGDGDGVADGWFDTTFDTFWDNPSPNWGGLDPTIDDDPELAMDATFGCGPEVLEFEAPEAGRTYRVGVHFWDDHDFTNITATLRIYFYGVPVLEVLSPLDERDLWEVAHIQWSDTPTVTLPKRCRNSPIECSRDADCGEGDRCGHHITPQYPLPGFFAP